MWVVYGLGTISGFSAAAAVFDRLVRRDPMWWRSLVPMIAAFGLAVVLALKVIA